MIPKKKLEEIRNYLIRSENPLFFFDDDPDGLCSFILLNKFIDGRGHGVVVKSSPELGVDYLGKVSEYGPDIVFVLDKPKLSQEFVDAVNVPIVYIDHHDFLDLKGVHYYNPKIWDKKSDICVADLCYQVVEQDLWIATVGSISDWRVPKYLKDFKKKYPGLTDGKKKPNDLLFDTRLGELCRIFSFLLKGKTSDVKRRINALFKITGPNEILNKETARGKYLFREAEKIGKRYNDLLKMAMAVKPRGKIHLFMYPSTQLSLTSDLSNELIHRFPERIVIVGREKSGNVKLGFRSYKIPLPPILEKALEGVEGYGGGHENACGGNIASKDFDKFLKNFAKLL